MRSIFFLYGITLSLFYSYTETVENISPPIGYFEKTIKVDDDTFKIKYKRLDSMINGKRMYKDGPFLVKPFYYTATNGDEYGCTFIKRKAQRNIMALSFRPANDFRESEFIDYQSVEKHVFRAYINYFVDGDSIRFRYTHRENKNGKLGDPILNENLVCLDNSEAEWNVEIMAMSSNEWNSSENIMFFLNVRRTLRTPGPKPPPPPNPCPGGHTITVKNYSRYPRVFAYWYTEDLPRGASVTNFCTSPFVVKTNVARESSYTYKIEKNKTLNFFSYEPNKCDDGIQVTTTNWCPPIDDVIIIGPTLP